MAIYKTSQGLRVKSVSSDPANIKEGRIWYNSSVKKIKVVPTIGAWASGGNSSTSKSNLGSFGIQTAAVQACGIIQPGAPSTDYSHISCEEYDGSSWTAGGNVSDGKRYIIGGGGTLTAGFIAKGSDGASFFTKTEEYDGSSWTTSGATSIGAQLACALGATQTAGLCIGGASPAGPRFNSTEEYDGSSWTTGGNMGSVGYSIAGAGTQTAGLRFGGSISDPTTSSNISEEYDGSSWTSGETAPYSQRGAGGSGTQTAAIFHGGKPPTVATAVTYDGTNWAAVANLATARDDHGTTNAAAGGNNLAASFNGNISGGRANTLEEWTEAATTRTVDVS